MSESSLELLASGSPVYGVFVVYDYLHQPVTGLTQSDFTIRLSYEGSDSSEAVTITEISSGRYLYSFTPLALGEWHILIIHSTYNPRGWDDEFIIEGSGIPEGGGSSWPFAKDYLNRMREQYRRLDEEERRRKSIEDDDEQAIILILSALED
jgi:hypothetical protein